MDVHLAVAFNRQNLECERREEVRGDSHLLSMHYVVGAYILFHLSYLLEPSQWMGKGRTGGALEIYDRR